MTLKYAAGTRFCKHCHCPLTMRQRLAGVQFCCAEHDDLHRRNHTAQLARLLIAQDPAADVRPTSASQQLLDPLPGAPPKRRMAPARWPKRPLMLPAAPLSIGAEKLMQPFGPARFVSPADAASRPRVPALTFVHSGLPRF